MSSYIEFVKNKNGNNILVPLVDIQGKKIEDIIPELPEAAKNANSEYYSSILPSKLPDDAFIRYYYISLSIIGLFVVFRLLMTGR